MSELNKKIYTSLQITLKIETIFKDFIYLNLMTPALDTEIYNSIYVTVLDGKILLISFNCTKELYDDWFETSEIIMNSIITSGE